MGKLDSIFTAGFLAVVFALQLWEDFPSMAALYGLMTAMAILYGLKCLLGSGGARMWQQWGVPEDVRRVWSGRMGVLYLLTAALCPLGWLLTVFVSFDTDFILLAQIAGFFLTSLLGFAPPATAGRAH